jgi:hypothetical protein
MSSLIRLAGVAGAAFKIDGAVMLAAGVIGLVVVELDCANPLVLAIEMAMAIRGSPSQYLILNIIFISVSVPGF